MAEIEQRIAALSPEQRDLLLRRLQERTAPAPTSVKRDREQPRILPSENRNHPVPLTGIQEAYWIGRSGLYDLGGCGANSYFEHQLTGSAWNFAAALNVAVRRLIERHEILRTIILDDGTQQVLPTTLPFEVMIEDLSGYSADLIEKRLAAIRREMLYGLHPIDRWPLFEILVLQLPAGMLRVHSRFDGMLIDGMARNRIIEELVQLVENPEAELSSVEISFLDHARSLTAFRDSDTYRRSQEYWMERIPTLPPWPVLPVTGEIGPASVPRIVKREEELLSTDAWSRLRQRTARLHLTPTGFLVAAFAELLRLETPSADFTLALEGSYLPPSHPQIREVIGNFATIQLLGIESAPGTSFTDRAQRLQRRLTEDLEHLHFSGHQVLRELNRRNRVGCHAVVPILFDSIVEFSHGSYQGSNDAPLEPVRSLPPVARGMVQLEQMISLPQVLLLCVVQQAPDGSLRMITQAVEEVLADGFVPAMVGRYAELLLRFAEDDALWNERSLFNESGKQFAALPSMGGMGEPVKAPASLPSADWKSLESVISGFWEEILGTRPTATTDDFYDLGGDSLRAARLAARLRSHFQIPSLLHDLLSDPTFGGMAKVVHRGLTARRSAPASSWHRITTGLRQQVASLQAGLRARTPNAETGRTPQRRNASYGMRIFITIWLGQFISTFGTGLGSFALGVWIYEKTGSTTQFAMIAVVAGTVALLASPISGALIDRWDRRRLMMTSALGSALTTCVMASLLLGGFLKPWHVYPIVAALVAFATLQGPALAASVSLLVPREHLVRASGMSQMSRSFAQILGPLCAGALVGLIGYHGVIYIDATSFAFALLTLLLVRIPSPPSAELTGVERRSFLRDVTFGWTYLRHRTGLFAILGLLAVTNFCMGIVQVLLTPLILSFATPMELGTVNSAGAAGVMMGSLVLSLWGGPRRRILGVFVFLAVQAMILFVGGVRPSIPLISLATCVFMFTVPMATACNQAILQSKVAADVQGRVFAMAGMIATGSVPLASLIAGPLADRVFGPLLLPGGALADTVIGQWIGVGPGRGVGLMFICLGVLVLLIVGIAFLNPRLRELDAKVSTVPGSDDDSFSAPRPSNPSLRI